MRLVDLLVHVVTSALGEGDLGLVRVVLSSFILRRRVENLARVPLGPLSVLGLLLQVPLLVDLGLSVKVCPLIRRHVFPLLRHQLHHCLEF